MNFVSPKILDLPVQKMVGSYLITWRAGLFDAFISILKIAFGLFVIPWNRPTFKKRAFSILTLTNSYKSVSILDSNDTFLGNLYSFTELLQYSNIPFLSVETTIS
ncbi:hypothetical protein BpHYR1_054309 [Brachionus plicatilis]|uniref:Uncharacterized protein n=1 Tax=Brachionus plicatilis TaxID=10195 RepID=A0A3M7T4R6_BRAPC|nr:hypothetical protein BpHYR1_054309 [Brachionus plicatilis]